MTAKLHIEDYIYLTLQVEGKDVSNSLNMIYSISIHENIMQHVPVMQFTFTDFGNELVKKLALSEATKVKITVGKTQANAVPREFRLFGFKQVAQREGPKLVANFILDCPKFATSSVTESYEGKSSDVIQELAGKCGLTAKDPTKTNDKQVWLNFGSTRASFLDDMTMHSFKDESACMIQALTTEKKLIYKDAMEELTKDNAKVVFSLNAGKDQGKRTIQVREIRDVSTSGAMNNWFNYGWKYPEHSLKGKEKLNKTYKAKITSGKLPINSDVKGAVQHAKLEYCSRLDCRNTHDNYNTAYYNNLRGRGLLSNKIHILIEEPSKVDLLDLVEYKHKMVDGQMGKATGKYLITAKVIFVTNGSHYYEKLELTRAVITEPGATPLASSD